MQRLGLVHLRVFDPDGKKLDWNYYRSATSADPLAPQTQSVRKDAQPSGEGPVPLGAAPVE